MVITILASYNGTLMSYLTVDIRRLPFSSLKQAIQSPQYKIRMNTKSVYEEIYHVSIIGFRDHYYYCSICSIQNIRFSVAILYPIQHPSI